MQIKCGEHTNIKLHEKKLQKGLMILQNQHQDQLVYSG
jgi:hypothetical protein